LMNDTDKAVELLDSFWRENSANSFWDRALNNWFIRTSRLFANTGGMPTVSPYFYPSWGQTQLKSMLEKHVDFARLGELVEPSSPLLLIGAANVLSGQFKAFSSRRDRIDVDVILASAAIPIMFRAVSIGKDVYWDGLFSQNPPIRELPDEKPDEIWVLQINPEASASEPKSMPDIIDRRNELSGNLSLNQEIYFIETVNRWVEEGVLSGTKHEVIEVKRIELLQDLDCESKFNRDPEFIQGLMAHGEEQAGKFLKEHAVAGEKTA